MCGRGRGGGASYGFVWKGEFAAAPSSPEKSWAYYDTALSQAFYWSGSAWLELRSIEGLAEDQAWAEILPTYYPFTHLRGLV